MQNMNSEAQLAMHSFGTSLKKNGNTFIVSGFCMYRFRDETGKELSPNKIRISIGTNSSCGHLSFFNQKGISLIKGIKLNRYTISFEEAELSNLDIQNKIQLQYGSTVARIGYNLLDRTKGKYKTSRVFNSGELACYLKQSIYNGMYLTVREPQVYDKASGRLKSLCAWLLAKIRPKNDIVFLFEKECSRYEESASVLYERLIDEGYNNVCYIVNKGNPALDYVDPKYKANIVYKDSFGHLLRFFRSKVFIGSETMSHAMQLRASDKRIARKTDSQDISYIFLQHGVMYMVSLNADLRVSFREKDLNLYRVVVSSKLEADHFRNLAGFRDEELYITGLATFDKSVRCEKADRIVIMPTWRRWETNLARQDFTKTKYYQMIKTMVDAVPDNLKDRIIILPHPLMQKTMDREKNELSRFLATESHNDTLKKCDLLITDYSSIAYDAYYRGSNIIFYWAEKDECMRNYGAETKLMIDETSAFGDVCYNKEDLATSITEWYSKPQGSTYQDRYRRIVEFHDGKNTHRIVELLKKDRVI